MTTLQLHPSNIEDEQTYYVVNVSRHHVSYSGGKLTDADYYTWKGANDTDATGDVRIAIPGRVVKQRAFQSMLIKGVLRMEDADTYYGSLQEEAASEWADDTSALENIDRSLNESVELLTCLGPPVKGSGKTACGDQIAVRASQLETKPPLCERHEKFAQYFTFVPGEGWTRIHV